MVSEILRHLTPAEQQELTELQKELHQIQVRPIELPRKDWQQMHRDLNAKLSRILQAAEDRARNALLRPQTIQRGSAAVVIDNPTTTLLEASENEN